MTLLAQLKVSIKVLFINARDAAATSGRFFFFFW